MIDWLTNGRPGDVFVTTPEGELTYEQLTSAMASRREATTTVLTPEPDVLSVLGIYRGVSRGPLVLKPRRGWLTLDLPPAVMTLLFTSGTTGTPKAVPLTEGNWRAAVTASAAHLGNTEEDEWLIAMPLHHVGGLSVLFRSSHAGGTVRMFRRFEAASFADALAGPATMASVVPTMLRRILDLDTRRYGGLRAVLVGGGPIPAGLLEEAWDRGIPALPTYGMTETCAQVATLRPGSPLAYKAHLLPGVEARIGDDGRIALRGDQVFTGYFGVPSVSPDGWFVTGDIGSVDEEGALRIEGRADDVIVTGGENVDPVAVESAVAALDGVAGVMVVGVPSGEWGHEVVCLFSGEARPEALDVAVRRVLEPHEVPKRWLRVGSIPVSELGKPDRHTGRAIALDLIQASGAGPGESTE